MSVKLPKAAIQYYYENKLHSLDLEDQDQLKAIYKTVYPEAREDGRECNTVFSAIRRSPYWEGIWRGGRLTCRPSARGDEWFRQRIIQSFDSWLGEVLDHAGIPLEVLKLWHLQGRNSYWAFYQLYSHTDIIKFKK